MKDLKYLVSYIPLLLGILGLMNGGILSYSAVAFAFAVVPCLDSIFPKSTRNFSNLETAHRLKDNFFDILLYLNLPLIILILFLFGKWVSTGGHDFYENLGQILSVGTILGASGINVAHELGHRSNKTEQLLAQALLLSSFYIHFFIEHNLGHHKNVATPEDPSSSRRNEDLYSFWFRSVVGSYVSAWKIESQVLKRKSLRTFDYRNRMFRYLILQLTYLLVIYSFTSLIGMFFFLFVGIIGFLLLETINYIEHYGLQRQKLGSERYERVSPEHSWNSNHELGRIILYELTRHSDHHYNASKKYQILDHHEISPQLPLGYPGSMLLAMIPPLWFRVMNSKIPNKKASP